MPHAFRTYTALKEAGVVDEHSLAVAACVAMSKAPGAIYAEEDLMTIMCDAGMAEALAEAAARTVANCFPSQRFNRHFNAVALKTNLVRGGWAAPVAAAFLDAVRPCVVTPHTAEVRSAREIRSVTGARGDV
jgi:hypothetical protein